MPRFAVSERIPDASPRYLGPAAFIMLLEFGELNKPDPILMSVIQNASCQYGVSAPYP